MSASQDSILHIVEAYKQAVLDKDVEAFMRLYDEDARVFDTWGVWCYEGAGPRRKVIEDWFSSLGAEFVRVTVDDVQIINGQGLCVVTAAFRYAGCSAEGSELRAMHNRLTWALRPGGKSWKIAHEHTSVPIGFDDCKAIFERQKA